MIFFQRNFRQNLETDVLEIEIGVEGIEGREGRL